MWTLWSRSIAWGAMSSKQWQSYEREPHSTEQVWVMLHINSMSDCKQRNERVTAHQQTWTSALDIHLIKRLINFSLSRAILSQFKIIKRCGQTLSVNSLMEATVVTSKWPLRRLKSMKRKSFTPRSMACWEAFITSRLAEKQRSAHSYSAASLGWTSKNWYAI